MGNTPKWLAHALAIVTVAGAIVATVKPLGWLDSHSASEKALLEQQKAEADRLKEHYLSHLADSWQGAGAKGSRKLSFSSVDDCLLDEDPRWKRVIPGYVGSAHPLVAADYFDMTAVVHAAEQGPRACPSHQQEAPASRRLNRDDGRWIQEIWTYRDGCWAYAWFDRGNPYAGWQIDGQGCRH